MDKMIPKEVRSGKKAVRNVALLLFGAFLGFSGASQASEGPALYVMVGASLVLLTLAAFEAGQWIWRTRSKPGEPSAH